jgi:hypothetical protein
LVLPASLPSHLLLIHTNDLATVDFLEHMLNSVYVAKAIEVVAAGQTGELMVVQILSHIAGAAARGDIATIFACS